MIPKYPNLEVSGAFIWLHITIYCLYTECWFIQWTESTGYTQSKQLWLCFCVLHFWKCDYCLTYYLPDWGSEILIFAFFFLCCIIKLIKVSLASSNDLHETICYQSSSTRQSTWPWDKEGSSTGKDAVQLPHEVCQRCKPSDQIRGNFDSVSLFLWSQVSPKNLDIMSMNESLRKVAGLLMVPQVSHYTSDTHRLCEVLLCCRLWPGLPKSDPSSPLLSSQPPTVLFQW